MCYSTQCGRCWKKTWAGCGLHVDQVLATIPEARRCKCLWPNDEPPPPFSLSSGRRRSSATSPSTKSSYLNAQKRDYHYHSPIPTIRVDSERSPASTTTSVMEGSTASIGSEDGAGDPPSTPTPKLSQGGAEAERRASNS